MRDFSSIAKEKEIQWVRYWIDASYEFSRNFIKSGTNEIDFEALGREEWEFRKALKTKDFSKNERAEYLWNEAMAIHKKNAANGKKGGRPKKSPQDAPNGNAGVDMSDAGNGAASKSPTSCGQLTGDASTREGEDTETSPGNGIGYGCTTVSNTMGADAATREGAEATTRGESRANRASATSASRTFKGRKKPFKAPTKEELYAYAQDKGLDEADARDCWEMCEGRQWADRDGVQIENWKTFVSGFCKSRKAKRSA